MTRSELKEEGSHTRPQAGGVQNKVGASTPTPGPWTHYDDASPTAYLPQHKIQSRGKSIATVYCTKGDEAADLANGRLIAAAPDFYEAAKALLAANELGEGGNDVEATLEYARGWDLMRAAFTKAGGQ